MKLKNFVKLCHNYDALIICSRNTAYDDYNYCDFVFSFESKDYKNNYWTGKFKVNDKAYKDSDVVWFEPFREKSIKVFVE